MQRKGFVESVNPATGESIERYRLESLEQCERRARKAETAFKAWRDLPIAERCGHIGRLAHVLRSRKNEFSRRITTEMGKTIVQSEAEVEKCAMAMKRTPRSG
jgi:succinate-semialdehyde dehydrogenase/glutarate-semialdehyde dehydrogenase